MSQVSWAGSMPCQSHTDAVQLRPKCFSSGISRNLSCLPGLINCHWYSHTLTKMYTQIAAQLRETEDELSRQKAMNEMMQHSTAAEIADLQSKCAHLEGQQADIDTLMSQNPSVASEIKKAYLTGKVEVQRTMRRTEKEIEGLRDALKHAEEKAVAAHGEVLELKVCIHVL